MKNRASWFVVGALLMTVVVIQPAPAQDAKITVMNPRGIQPPIRLIPMPERVGIEGNEQRRFHRESRQRVKYDVGLVTLRMGHANVDGPSHCFAQFFHVDLWLKNEFCRFHRRIHISGYRTDGRGKPGNREWPTVNAAESDLRTAGIVFVEHKLEPLRLPGDLPHDTGLYGQLKKGSKWAALSGQVEHHYRWSVVETIYAGTSEIQRNIMALRGLKLPSK